MLADNQMFSAANVFKLEQLLGLEVTSEQLFDSISSDTLDPSLSALFALFMQNVLQMCWALQQGKLEQFADTL